MIVASNRSRPVPHPRSRAVPAADGLQGLGIALLALGLIGTVSLLIWAPVA